MTRIGTAPGPDIVVPGSIGNLGPGFDALSLAVQVYLRVRVVAVMPGAPDTLRCDIIGAPVTGDNRVATAYRHARAAVGLSAPGLHVEVQSDIPSRAGLGSSSAATVAGLRLYESVTKPRPAEDWLRLACALEGHPDNAAAALFGGMALSCQLGDGRVIARAWPWPAHVPVIVATPRVEVATDRARAVLPASIPLQDGVFNLQHALLLVHAVREGTPEDLREALQDRWHQGAREPLVPGLTRALALRHPALLGICLSGAGPSIVAFAGSDEAAVIALLENLYQQLGIPCAVRAVAVHQPVAAGLPSAAALMDTEERA